MLDPDETIKNLDIVNPFENLDENLEWLELDDIPEHLPNPLNFIGNGEVLDPVSEMVGVFLHPDYLHFAARMLLRVELAPYQAVILDVLWKKRFPMLIGSRGAAKSYIMAIYALLRMIFHPGCHIVIVGAGLRQSRNVFDYMARIWSGSDILRDIAGKSKTAGPRREVDRYQFELGNSRCFGIPLGTGEKIRGLRANYILADEFDSINEEIFNVVVQGFGIVASSPIEKMKEAAMINKLKKLDVWTEQMEALRRERTGGNQIVYSGTAGYAFKHFYKYFTIWKDIIYSKGNTDRMREIFGDSEIAKKGFNYTDYGIIRLPYKYVPEGILDSAMLAQAKATLTPSQFNMEYGACLHPDQEIVTDTGIKKIVDVKLEDFVLTHKGRFRKVNKLTVRPVSENILEIKTYGHNQPILVTDNHLFWDGNEEWIYPESIKDVKIPHILDLNNNSHINLSDYSEDVLFSNIDGIEYIYPRPSQNISKIATNKLFKSSIINKVNLDYDFGLIVGYYASEGSCGSKGRSINFALDGHKDIKLESYIDELIKAINKSFNKFPQKIYRDNGNTCCVILNSRILVSVIKKICPGVSHTKLIDHNILFSNRDFIKGYIKGYWSGDGHISVKNNVAIAGCVNKSLLMQIKLCLSVFGISSSINNGSRNDKSIFRGKEYCCRPKYNLTIQGDNFREFYKFIYEKDYIPNSTPFGFIRSSKEYTSCDIISISKTPYNGLVYNLEVEEDYSYSLLNACVHNCFARDSDGFFKRSVLEAATTNKPITLPSGKVVQFNAINFGDPQRRYVIGVDPAADKDNAAIVTLELHEEHRRVVNCWTTNRKKYNELKKKLDDRGEELEPEYYRYIARKIRDLMKNFNTERIIMDKNGGGIGIAEALSNPGNCQTGELPIYELIDPENPKANDMKEGLHILELITPTNDINAEANHGMLKDLQSKTLLFPMFDSIEIAKSIEVDYIEGNEFDTYEDLIYEIEELKSEIASIVVTGTSTLGKENFDTPQIKGTTTKKGRLRKDRYSALLYANFHSRNKNKQEHIEITYKAVGGTKDTLRNVRVQGGGSNQMYYGPGMLRFGAKANKAAFMQGHHIKVLKHRR
jgi:hypothetical protein